MKAFHQIRTAESILKQYQLDQPLHRFLSQYYRQNKQMGSKDRRVASRLVYNYFRLGKALADKPLEERLVVADFLGNNKSNSFIDYYKPDWSEKVTLPLPDKIKLVSEEVNGFILRDVFPFEQHLSTEVNKTEFYESFFIQPDLYIRVQRGYEGKVAKLLAKADVDFTQLKEQTFAFPNGTKLDQLLPDKGIYEVQDLSSQQVGEFFKPEKWDKWWDCCAASGGKSLLLHDEEPSVKLLVTDNRDSILENLKERFSLAKITKYQAKIMDLTVNQDLFLHDYEFEGIIFDAPCSGSGTWGRTPEMISQFADHKIEFFTELQRKIATNVVKYLKPGKPLIYITCSVFKAENEDQVTWLSTQFDLEVESTKLIKGYEHRADNLFVARLIKK